MVSDKAKEKLVDYQHLHRMQTQDEALDKILLELEVKAIQV